LKNRLRRSFPYLLPILCFFLALAPAALTRQKPPTPQQQPATVEINTQAPTTPFPHFWEEMFGSGRAILSLRADYRHDLRAVKRITGFDYVRFHGIFDRDVGLYQQGPDGKPVYNFSYVDQIYDGLLRNGVRPFVELSFMPPQLAAQQIFQPFWYHPVISPPKSWNAWGDLIHAFTEHLVKRYGINEVSHWYFEVWNEPNIGFWAGKPKQATYFRMYDVTARAIKKVSPRLRVGGPSTAQAAWVPAFIRHAVKDHVPVDFVSTHTYGNDTAENVFGTKENIPRKEMVCRAVKKVHDEVKSSARPGLPIIYSEYNASYMNEPDVTDSIYMGPWLANSIRQCDGMTKMMSYWTFSDVFEEQGPVKKPFYGGFGLIAEGGVPKPAFNAFRLLHMLGHRRIPVHSDSVLATSHKDGSLSIAVWNYSAPKQPGKTKTIVLRLEGLTGTHSVSVYRLDSDHGNALRAYRAMGSPTYPTQKQYRELRKAGQLSPPQTFPLENNRISLKLTPKALDLVEIH
jgi:xylan 1,4-beta-xylosidase